MSEEETPLEVQVQSKGFEERLADLETQLAVIDKALGAVVAFVREHNHDKVGNPYVPQNL